MIQSDPFEHCKWGWPADIKARREHYWPKGIDGASLCGRYLTAYGNFDETPTKPCKDCQERMTPPASPNSKRIAQAAEPVREPLPPIPANAPKRGTRWKHVKSKEQYGILCVAYNEADLSIQVVYTRAQTVWIRPLENFLERFRPDPVRIYGSAQAAEDGERE